MEVNDLRIKNWVLVENDYEQVVAIDTYNVKCSLDGAEGVWQHKNHINPIPLTKRWKEWLRRFGFKAKKKNGKTYYYDKDESIRIDRNYGDTIFFVSMGYDTLTEDQPETIWCIISDVKYVHELQNLYYELTKQELQYKTR